MTTPPFRLAALLLLAATATPALATNPSLLSTQTHGTSFTGAGGDARYGTGTTPDATTNLVVYNLLPLFDPGLGTLERVSFTLTGWRSFDAVCATPAFAERLGTCSARIDGAFFLDALNLGASPQALPMASINPVQLNFTSVTPALGSSLPINLLANASASGEITHAGQLATYFTANGIPNQGIRLRFSPQDGGYFGMGGSTGFTAMLWDADATVSLTYHYAAAVPEPAGWASLAAGLGALAWLRRRRNPARG